MQTMILKVCTLHAGNLWGCPQDTDMVLKVVTGAEREQPGGAKKPSYEPLLEL